MASFLMSSVFLKKSILSSEGLQTVEVMDVYLSIDYLM